MIRAFTRTIVSLRQSPLAAFAGPFVVFMVLLEGIRFFRIENEYLPWWRQYPEHWGYPLQTLVCLFLVWWWRRHYPRYHRDGCLLGILAGLVGIAIWLAPPFLHAWTGIGDQFEWLRWLGFRERLEGFDPYVLNPESDPLAHYLTLGFRFLRLVVIVSLVEEIFWRGFLMRYLIGGQRHWSEEPVGQYGHLSFWMTTVLFASVHAGPDLVPALCYGALAGWVTLRTKNLWAVVIMHATANLTLGIVIMSTRWWGLW